MAEKTKFHRRDNDAVKTSESLAELFPNWRGDKECWVFVSPHDDDSVVGGSLMIQAARAASIPVHTLITTDGRMGYCSHNERHTIVDVREKEARDSFRILGVDSNNVHFLHFPDCSLNAWRGRRADIGQDIAAIKGHTGMQNSYTYYLRQIRPSRVFVPTVTDLHPDHQVTNQEMLISLFHAQGTIWPELGDPIEFVPDIYEYAAYCDFSGAPQIKIDATDAMLETKFEAIAAYQSQRQIGMVIDGLRGPGPVEYFHEVEFNLYSPSHYKDLF